MIKAYMKSIKKLGGINTIEIGLCSIVVLVFKFYFRLERYMRIYISKL